LRDVQALRRSAEVQLLGDGEEVTKMPELEMHRAYRRKRKPNYTVV